jgi:PGF-pre-PGF domain-containing protein
MNLINVVSVTTSIEYSGYAYVTVSKPSELPYGVTPPSCPVYSYFEIVVYDQMGTLAPASGEIEFVVSNSWLSENVGDVVLLKYDASLNDWIELPTEKVREDAYYTYYKAVVPSFSLFAVAVKPTVPPTPTVTVTVTKPTPTPTKVTPTPTTVTPTIPPTTTTVKPTPTPEVKPPINWTLIAIAVVVVLLIVALAVWMLRRR